MLKLEQEIEAFQNLLKTCLSLLEEVWRVATGAQLGGGRGGGEFGSPSLFRKLKKSALKMEKKKTLTKFL